MRTRDEEGRREGESIAKNGGENGGKRRGARTAMRRRLRHHGGVRRISCESGNSSQLTAGRTASLRVERGEKRRSDSATINIPLPLRVRVTRSLSLSLFSSLSMRSSPSDHFVSGYFVSKLYRSIFLEL